MAETPLLEIDGVEVSVGADVICRDVSLTINEGESHLLLGPNGSGKSSLLNALMGTGPFAITAGTVRLAGEDITDASVTDRARKGLGMAVQRPPAIQGVSVAKLAEAIGADSRLEAAAEELNLHCLLPRDVNDGFSGGETKRWEVMKLLLQKPQVCLFDEPESGVDLEHVNTVGEAINRYLTEPGTGRAGLIITHTGFILDHLTPTTSHLMVDGRIVATGDADDMLTSIRTKGYAAYAV